tara:strand:+ start:3321 stop:4826 length:1506 start_codon:yes stop_codon:yes gene_type:complete
LAGSAKSIPTSAFNRLEYTHSESVKNRELIIIQSMENTFETIVIGSGPGGYVAAIRSAQLGKKVALIEKYPVLGGTCTNVGCIPSKALLDSSEHYHDATTKFNEFGIEITDISLNFPKFIQRKNEVVRSNNRGLEYLMKKNKIVVFEGVATFISKNQIKLKKDQGEEILAFHNAIIATGSKPASIKNITLDKDRIISSTEALSFRVQPKSMIIIGGGAIGVELASVYARIGTEITIIEYEDSLLPNMDIDLGKALFRKFKKDNIQVYLGAKVTSVQNLENRTLVKFINAHGQEEEKISDYTMLAVGRTPYTKNLGLEKIGIQTDNKGFVLINEKLQTNIPNIYAIGDVIGGAMLAHKAEEEGAFVAETIDGQKPFLDHNAIPNVVYTWPEIASVGLTEQELTKKNIDFKTSKIPIAAFGRARAAGEKDGFVKVLAHPKYGEILGVHIFGPRAADMISLGVTALVYEITDLDMTNISYPHPSYTEAIKEAFLEVSGKGTINL